jgi:serine/threonine-protein kinase HipA
MKRTIGVYFGAAGRRVGTLRFDGKGARQSAAFEYDRKWLTASDRFALEPNLPSVAGPQFHKPSSREASIFHGAIADTQPDGWARRGTLRVHAKRRTAARDAGQAQDHQPLTPIDVLLEVDDVNRVGGLRYQDEEGLFQRAQEDGRRTAPPLIELSMLMSATRAVETNTEAAEDLAYSYSELRKARGVYPNRCQVHSVALIWH